MGIKNFYLGFKQTFSSCITTSVDYNYNILIIEMNGLFYSSCKNIYHTQNNIHKIKRNELYIKLFQDICDNLKKIIEKYDKAEKIFLVVDGVAGMMKNVEQRQRRYKNSFENKYEKIFDLNCFSPGTKILHFLTKYIDWFIRNEMNQNINFQNIEIFFSNEKVSGEGEYKIIQFIKNKCKKTDKIFIYTCDSDMILLSLLLFENEIILIRNSSIYGFEYVHVDKCRNLLLHNFSFDNDHKETMKDFYLLFFLLGNDYISNSPCIFNFHILYDEILPLYKKNKKHFFLSDINIHFENFCNFLYSLRFYEEKWIKQKYKQNNSYFPDPIFIQNNLFNNTFDMKEYIKQYKKNHQIENSEIVYFYLSTLQNLCNMFFSKEFNWGFYYPYYKSPFLSDFIFNHSFSNIIDIYLKEYNNKTYQESFYHLITVLPPQSKYLLPSSLQDIFLDLKFFYPSYIEIDLTGKYKIWEGTVKLPMIQNKKFQDYYKRKKINFSDEEHKRNIHGKIFYYKYLKNHEGIFQSYYGKIESNSVYSELIDI